MAGVDASEIMKTNIIEDSNSSLAAVGQDILDKNEGQVTIY